MKQKMAQCYKILIDDTCTFEDVWYGRNAKIFEGCELSQDGSDEVDLEFYTWEIKDKQEDKTWIGTSQPYSDVYCWVVPGIGQTTAGGSETNMSKWAKSAFITVNNAMNIMNHSSEKNYTTNVKDYIPQYELPW